MVVALTVAADGLFPVASTARTVYEYVVLAVSPLSVNVEAARAADHAWRRGTPGNP